MAQKCSQCRSDRTRKCSNCRGSGQKGGAFISRQCPTCNGKGQVCARCGGEIR